MKKLIILSLVVVFASCTAERSPEVVKAEINEKKVEITTLSESLKTLETELLKLDTVNHSRFITVKVKEMNFEPFDHYFVANGSLEPVKSAYISPQMNGQIDKIYVKEGQRVKKGTLLVALNADVTKNGIAELETGLEFATITFNKQKELWDQGIGSEIQFLQVKNQKESLELKLKTLKSQVEMTEVRAPIDGIVDNVLRKEGEMAGPGMQLIELINLSEMYVNADVSESYLPVVKKGASALVTVPTFPDFVMETKVFRTGNVIKQSNRTFLLQLKIRNQNEMLKPNNLARIQLSDFSTREALLVPSNVLKNDIKGAYLFVAKAEGGKNVASKRYVETGMSDQTNTLVTEGLSVSEMVITAGYHLVKEGTEIRF